MKTKQFKKLFGGVLIFLFCAAFELYAGGGRGGGGGGGGGGRGGGGIGGGFGGFGGGGIGGGGGGFGGGAARGGGANSSQYNNNGTVGIAQIYVDPTTHNIMVVADAVTAAQVQETLARLDAPQPQVLIRVVFLEVNNNKASDIGINGQYTGRNGTWSTFGGFVTNGLQTISTTTQNGTTSTTSTTYQPILGLRQSSMNVGTAFGLPQTLSGAAGFGGVEQIMSDNFTATLQAIAAAGKAQVLSRPTILAANGQIAEIVVGQSVYLPSGVSFTSVSGSSTTVPTINGSYQNVGIQLDVTPSIQMNGLVQMIVVPQITSIDTSTPGQQIVGSTLFSGAVYAPNINKRSANTVVTTPDGQPVVIGGLISNQKSSNVTKVPILGDIPLFGQLFKFTNKAQQKNELDIFLTPHIVQAPAQLLAMGANEINQSDMIRESVSEQLLNRYLEGLPLDASAPPARVSTGGFMRVPPPSNPPVPNP
jgi:general secretion pathway protein D